MRYALDEYICLRCGEYCVIDGTAPKFFCWCDTCGDYAEDFNAEEYAADELARRIDAAELRVDNDK